MLTFLRTTLGKLDAFPKTYEDFLERTHSGGLVSVVACMIILSLLLADVASFAFTSLPPRVTMDVETGGLEGNLTIHFNLTFSRVPCAELAVTVTDAYGAPQRSAVVNATAQAVDHVVEAPDDHLPRRANAVVFGVECRPCPQLPTPPVRPEDNACCNSCEAVREFLLARGVVGGWRDTPQCSGLHTGPAERSDAQGGCRVRGYATVERCAGQLHFMVRRGPGAGTGMHALAITNTTHAIERFGFGHGSSLREGALDRTTFVDTMPEADVVRVYWASVVPTTLVAWWLDAPEDAYEYAVSERTEAVPRQARGIDARTGESPGFGALGETGAAGVAFAYEISPITVKTVHERRRLGDLVASATAIAGGGFTIAMLIDACLYATAELVCSRDRRRYALMKLHSR